MRAYRAVWSAAMTVAALVALLVGGPRLGWWGLAVSVTMFAGLGAAFGRSWDIDRRWRTAWTCTVWFALVGLLLVGLPHAVGGWALLILPALGASSPPVVRQGVEWCRERWSGPAEVSLEGLGARDLERRWRRTWEQLHDHRTSPAVALELVRQRELLLDEIERRDPDEFAARLTRAGWRGAGSVVE